MFVLAEESVVKAGVLVFFLARDLHTNSKTYWVEDPSKATLYQTKAQAQARKRSLVFNHPTVMTLEDAIQAVLDRLSREALDYDDDQTGLI